MAFHEVSMASLRGHHACSYLSYFMAAENVKHSLLSHTLLPAFMTVLLRKAAQAERPVAMLIWPFYSCIQISKNSF